MIKEFKMLQEVIELRSSSVIQTANLLLKEIYESTQEAREKQCRFPF